MRGWDKNVPSQMLTASAKRSWVKLLRRLGLEVLVPLWRHIQDKSPATRSRWQWTRVVDDSVFKKYGDQLAWWALGGAAGNIGCSRTLYGYQLYLYVNIFPVRSSKANLGPPILPDAEECLDAFWQHAIVQS